MRDYNGSGLTPIFEIASNYMLYDLKDHKERSLSDEA